MQRICNSKGNNSHGLQPSKTTDIYNDIEDLKYSQLANGEAIPSLSDSICHFSSVLSQVQDFINARKETVLD